MGTKAVAIRPGSPPVRARENDDRRGRLAAIGCAVELLHALDSALERIDDEELGRLAAEARRGERALDDWARQVEAFRASKQLFAAGILPDPAGRRRRMLEGLVLARIARRSRDASPRLPFVWEALAFVVGFVLSLLVT